MAASVIKPPEQNITAEIMIERARGLIPVLRERASEAERLRTLSQETVDDFLAAGFYRILQPARFGGYELGLGTFCEVMTQIARGCASSGWVLCLTSAHTFHMAACAEEGQIEMYGEDGNFRSPLILAPQGTATPVEGGYRLNGRWNYNSGGEHANWVAVSAIVPGDSDGPPQDLLLAFMRREDYEIFDNWHTMGMRATGSKQAIVEDVFVPATRVVSQPAWGMGQAPGYGVHENPFYRTPHMEVFCAEIASVCLGVGESAVDVFVERAESKVSPFPPNLLLKEEEGTQRRLGLARARLDVAKATLDRIISNQDAYCEQAAAGTLEFSKQAATRTMMLTQQVARLCDEAVELLFERSGTSATQSGQALERIYRDLATIRTHYIMDAERSAMNWGAMHFGLEEHTPY